MPDLFLGVDGGQSSTTALIANAEGTIIGRGIDGPCNHISGSEAEAKFRRVIGGCIAAAAAEAGLRAATISFRAACLGFSGGAADKDRFVRELIRSGHIKTTDDAEIALAGALAGEPGIIVISGTGTIAFGRNEKGKSARTGGWGYLFGDEGGAFDLVRRGLRVALQHEEGWGVDSILREKLLLATGAKDANAMMHAFYTQEWSRSRIAALAPVITAAAEAGDIASGQLLRDAARALSSYPIGVYRQLFTSSVPVVAVGGTWTARVWRDAFTAVMQEAIQCPVIEPRLTPAEGAVLSARQLIA